MCMTIWKINQPCWCDIIEQDVLVTSAKGGGLQLGSEEQKTIMKDHVCANAFGKITYIFCTFLKLQQDLF